MFKKEIIKMLFSTSVLMLTGCSTIVGIDSKELEPFSPKKEKDRVLNKVVMSWKVSDNPSEDCRRLSSGYFIRRNDLLGCAVWNAETKECTIITTKKVSHMILGHEVRHCFEGNFHD